MDAVSSSNLQVNRLVFENGRPLAPGDVCTAKVVNMSAGGLVLEIDGVRLTASAPGISVATGQWIELKLVGIDGNNGRVEFKLVGKHDGLPAGKLTGELKQVPVSAEPVRIQRHGALIQKREFSIGHAIKDFISAPGDGKGKDGISANEMADIFGNGETGKENVKNYAEADYITKILKLLDTRKSGDMPVDKSIGEALARIVLNGTAHRVLLLNSPDRSFMLYFQLPVLHGDTWETCRLKVCREGPKKRAVTQGIYTVELSAETRNLGQVGAVLRWDGKALTVELEAAADEAVKTLAAFAACLKQRLQGAGFDVNGITARMGTRIAERLFETERKFRCRGIDMRV